MFVMARIGLRRIHTASEDNFIKTEVSDLFA